MKTMFRMKKRWAMAVMIVLLLTVFTMPAYAASDDDLNDYSEEYSQIEGYPKTVRWSFTDAVHVSMGISTDGTATVDTIVDGYSGVTTKIVIYSYMQRHTSSGWVNVAGISGSYNNWYAVLEKTLSAKATWGYDYRVYSSIYVYSGSQYEHINAYSAVYHYHSSGGGTDCTL